MIFQYFAFFSTSKAVSRMNFFFLETFEILSATFPKNHMTMPHDWNHMILRTVQCEKRWCGIFFLSFHNIHCTKCFGSFCHLILLNRALLSLCVIKQFFGLPGFARPVSEMPYIQKWWCGIFFLSFHNIHCTKCFGSFCYLSHWILLNRVLFSLVCDKAIPWFTRLENSCTVCGQRFLWTSGFRRPLWEFAQLRHSLVYQVSLAQFEKCLIYKSDDVAHSFVHFTTFTVPEFFFFCYLDLVN